MVGDSESDQEEVAATFPFTEELGAFAISLNKESDRGAVLVAASYLDDLLGRLLHAFLVQGKPAKDLTDGSNSSFGSFSARTAGCHALGLIDDKIYRAIDTIRRIRNDFAREMIVSFEHQSVIDRCKNLKLVDQHGETIPLPPKLAFIATATKVVTLLQFRLQSVDKHCLQVVQWENEF